MTLGHPLVDAAVSDLRLTPVDLRVFRVLWGQLDFENYREKKSEVLAVEISRDRAYAAVSLRRLVEFGYLEAGPRAEKNVGTYRLPRVTPQLSQKTHMSAPPRKIRRQVRDSL